jgi:hypothetical protein
MIGGYVLFAILSCAAAAKAFVAQWYTVPSPAETCRDRDVSIPKAERAAFDRCVDKNAKTFLEFGYPEAKDLSKAFLTLMVALLVASITFSEKIVDLDRSSWWPRGLMIACWVLILTAIGGAGSGLALLTGAARWAARDPTTDYAASAMVASRLLVWAGLFFGSGLAALFAAGLISLAERSSRTAS